MHGAPLRAGTRVTYKDCLLPEAQKGESEQARSHTLLMVELKSKPSLTVAWPAAPSKQPRPGERAAGERLSCRQLPEGQSRLLGSVFTFTVKTAEAGAGEAGARDPGGCGLARARRRLQGRGRRCAPTLVGILSSSPTPSWAACQLQEVGWNRHPCCLTGVWLPDTLGLQLT